jgi:hypothetical protein
MGLTVEITDDVIDRIARRMLELQGTQQQPGEADGWLRGAEKIAAYIDARVSRVHHHREIGLPVKKEGGALMARKSELDAWVERGGGRRS